MSKIVIASCVILFFLLCSCHKDIRHVEQAKAPLQEGLSAKEYVSISIKLFYQFKLDESINAANKALQLKPDTGAAYDVLCADYNLQKNWPKAVDAGEKAFSINTVFFGNLVDAYTGIGNYKAAKSICEKVLQSDPENSQAKENLKDSNDKLVEQQRSTVVSVILMLVFALLFFRAYKKHKTAPLQFIATEIVLLSASVSCLLYFVFFRFADFIHSFNLKVSPDEITKMLRGYTLEHDGIEGYTLYSLFLVGMVLVVVLHYFISAIRNEKNYLFIFFPLLVVSCIYISTIKFFPPQDVALNKISISFILLFVIVALMLRALEAIAKYNSKMLALVVPLLLVPVCFVATEPISVPDYSFIFDPALRLLHGFKPSQIYFQYDIFLSLLAALWMKMKIDINLFQVLGQLSFYLLFTGAFWFARKWFAEKRLSIYLLVVLVIARYYAVDSEPVALLQITPLRLDLWFILLMVVYFKGSYHWLTGLLLGALILLHRNFGLIYLISYYGLISVLALADIPQEKTMQSFLLWIKKHFLLNIKNAGIILLFAIISVIVFKGFMPESAVLYQKIGFGMLPVSAISFYWYVPVVFGVAAVMLVRQRHSLSPQYFSTGTFLLFLALGNSIYFFGRSHENNILNISAALVLSLFMAIDLLNNAGQKTIINKKDKKDLKLKKSDVKKQANTISFTDRIKRVSALELLTVTLVFGAVYYYYGKITNKVSKQYENISHLQFVYPMPVVKKDFSAVEELTHNSQNVYFLDYYDFTYYYYGNYTPLGYYCPLASCPFVTDLTVFLQDLLNRHYYLVTDDMTDMNELLPKLTFNRMVEKDGFTVISKENIELLLTSDTDSLVHIGLAEGLVKRGLELPSLKLKNTFTIELLLKPSINPIDYAVILSNASDVDMHKGFMLQQIKNSQTQCFFAFWNSNKEIIPIPFNLQPDVWNYLVIKMTADKVKIYNNGKLLASKDNTSPIINSDESLVIGNTLSQNMSFNGYIKEVKITDGEVSEEDILKNNNNVFSKLR